MVQLLISLLEWLAISAFSLVGVSYELPDPCAAVNLSGYTSVDYRLSEDGQYWYAVGVEESAARGCADEGEQPTLIRYDDVYRS